MGASHIAGLSSADGLSDGFNRVPQQPSSSMDGKLYAMSFSSVIRFFSEVFFSLADVNTPATAPETASDGSDGSEQR